MQKSVSPTSLSMVFGMPTTLTSFEILTATPRVSSPPMTIKASNFNSLKLLTTFSRPFSIFAGLVLELPKIVPPLCRSPETLS